MIKNKKIIHIFMLISFIIVFFVGGSMLVYAAMTAREEKINEFQVGHLQTQISEVFTEPTSITAGVSVNKKVQITNSGTINQFVRVMLFPEIKKDLNGEVRILPVSIGKELLVDLNTTDWSLGEDGYYYYLNSVKPGDSEATTALFTKVTLSQGLDSAYTGAKVSLLVKVEATNCTGLNYRDAWWQGQTPTSGNLKSIDTVLTSKVDN